VIIGSAVCAGHWLGPAKDLVTLFGDELAARPVWLFSSGPGGNPSGKLAQAMGKDPVGLPAMRAASHVRDHRMFAGKLDWKSLSRRQQAALLVFGGLDGDFRDWAEIRQWADSIAAELMLASPLSSRGGSDVCFGVSRPGRCCPGSSPGARAVSSTHAPSG
jgi:menaquinone-dependent protoporphyrinogen oxidase